MEATQDKVINLLNRCPVLKGSTSILKLYSMKGCDKEPSFETQRKLNGIQHSTSLVSAYKF
jgi:hypothetical protein